MSEQPGLLFTRVHALQSLPCDGAWPEARVAVLERWIRAGCAQ